MFLDLYFISIYILCISGVGKCADSNACCHEPNACCHGQTNSKQGITQGEFVFNFFLIQTPAATNRQIHSKVLSAMSFLFDSFYNSNACFHEPSKVLPERSFFLK